MPSHLQRPKSSPVLMAARFVTIGLSNEACSPGRIPPVGGPNLGVGFGLLMEVRHSLPARRPVDQFRVPRILALRPLVGFFGVPI